MTVRRLKTYTGSQGYVYQYYFVGQRIAPAGDGVEYTFDVTSDRKTTYSVGVVLPRAAILAWNDAHGRALTGSEQYAAVKLRLFRAFDELSQPRAEGLGLTIDLPFLEESLKSLGLE